MSSHLDRDAVDAIAELARTADTPEELEPGKIYHVPQSDGQSKLIDLTGDQYRDIPRRKQGDYTVLNHDGFAHYWAKHRTPDSEIWAFPHAGRVFGVLNAHGELTTGWEDHRVILRLEHSPQFEAWSGINGRMLSQEVFAEFIEEWLPTIAVPAAAEVLELVQTFHATTSAEFKSGHILQSGQRQLQYVESTSASGGRNGQMQIPATLELRLPIYRRADVADRLTARLRYRVDSGRLLLGVKLNTLDEVVEGAFQAVVDQVQESTGAKVLYAA